MRTIENTLLVLSKLINGVIKKNMSNLFKSKFVLGLMLVAAFAFISTASAAITSTLKLGSNNSQVKEL